jgi:PAS domain S-box-containing protein
MSSRKASRGRRRAKVQSAPPSKTLSTAQSPSTLRGLTTRRLADNELRRDVTELKKAEARQRMYFAVTRVLAEAATLSEAAPWLLEAICGSLGWQVGSIWTVDRPTNRLRCVDVWHLPSLEISSFERITREISFPAGVGMPGRVWASGKPAWISDVVDDSNFPRAAFALQDGLHAACGFPIESRGEILGVIEFFRTEPCPPDPELMSALADLGSRVGQFIDRRIAEEGLREREENYRALFEINPLPMWLRDPDTLQFVAVNEAALQQYGYSREEFLQMTVRDILAPEEVESIAEFRWDRTTGIEPWNAGVRKHRRKDGTFLWVEVSGRDLVTAGRRLRLILANDVTERKHVEEEHRFLAEASSILGSSLDYEVTLPSLARLAVTQLGDCCVIDLLDEQGAIRRVAFSHADPEKEPFLSRYPPNPSAPIGVHHVLRAGESELIRQVTQSMLEEAAWDPEHLRLLEENVFSYLCVPLKARDRTLGAMTLILSVPGRTYGEVDLHLAEELARRVALAVENARLFADAREASTQKSRFLSAVSHDLRTPANAITLLSSLIRKEAEQGGVADGTRLLDRCRRLETASSSFADLLSDLLEIGSFDSGQKRLHEEEFALSDLVDECLATCAAAARQKGLRLRAWWDTPPPGVRADRTEFGRVLTNLVSNAVKFTERGLVKIEVSRAPGGALELRVRDTGPGIPAEHLTSIFSEFFQVRNDERDRSKGSGLGLAISRRIMQAFGGSLQVESRVGAGSVFTATLPAERVLGEPPASSGLSEAPLTGRDLPDRASILVIDDDAISREALTVLLEEEGYEVLTASGGEEGLKAVEEHRPNVLLLDMMMPGMDGVEVIRRIRRQPHLGRVRIIALTGDVTRERRQRVFESGADQFVAKPFRIPELLDSVREILRPA